MSEPALDIEHLPSVLTPKQVAELMQCTQWHVYNMIYDEKLPAAKMGRLVRIRRRDVLKLFK